MIKPKTWKYRGSCNHETLCTFSVAVTNGWDGSDMDRPRYGLVYLWSRARGPTGYCLDHEARPVHRVPHSFGAWLGYGPLTRGFQWESETGTRLTAVANRFGGYELLLEEHSPKPTGTDNSGRGSFYRSIFEAAGVRFESLDVRVRTEDALFAVQDRLSGY